MPRLLRPALLLTAALALVAAVFGLPSPARASGPPLTGPDVASYQHPNGAPIDWVQVRRSGQAFAFIKATESTTYTNPYFASDWHDAAAAGLYRGTYHYARPSADPGSAAAQAQYFANVIGPQRVPGVLPPILDLEETGGLGVADLQQWVATFLGQLASLTGRTPMIYTYPNFWANAMGGSTAFTAYPLWVADYGVSSPQTLGWGHWTFWQYTSSGSVPGISSPGATDLSYFNGTPLDLSALALTGTWGPPTSTVADSGPGPAGSTGGTGSARYVPTSPQRFVDTRSGTGAPSGPITGPVTVTVPATVPPTATGVVLDVSAVNPRGAGWLRVAAAGTMPTTTAVNYPLGHSVTSLVVTATDAQRQVTVTPGGAATQLVVDLVGYYADDGGVGGHWNPVTPQRVVDTRYGYGAPSGRASGQLAVTLPDAVPVDATGVVLDVTAVAAPGDGYLRLAASGTQPTTTALNYQAGGSTTGLAITSATARQLTVTIAGSPTDLVVDLVGYYDAGSTSGSAYVPVTPQRFLDTRSGLGASGPGTGPLALTVPAAVPSDALAVILDVSVVSPDRAGYLRLTAPGTDATTTAVNAVPGVNRTGLVITGIRDGQLTLALYGSKAHLVIDLVGYQAAVPAPPTPSPTASASGGPSSSASPLSSASPASPASPATASPGSPAPTVTGSPVATASPSVTATTTATASPVTKPSATATP